MADPLQVVLGVMVLWVPGVAVAWAFLPRLDWAKFVVLSVVLGLTIAPALFYVLNVYFEVPFTSLNLILISWTVASAAGAVVVNRRLSQARP